MPEGTREPLKIAELVDERNVIRDRTFEDRLIIGPAVLVPVGRVDVTECEFPGPIEHFVWLLPQHTVYGPIGLNGCVFRRCTFSSTVGFAANDAFRRKFIADLLR